MLAKSETNSPIAVRACCRHQAETSSLAVLSHDDAGRARLATEAKATAPAKQRPPSQIYVSGRQMAKLRPPPRNEKTRLFATRCSQAPFRFGNGLPFIIEAVHVTPCTKVNVQVAAVTKVISRDRKRGD